MAHQPVVATAAVALQEKRRKNSNSNNSSTGYGTIMQHIVLRHMKKGQSGTIATVKASGELGRRLQEMGLIPGTKIKIQGRAPLRDPIAIRVMDSTLTLRNNEADHIMIDITPQ